MSLFLFSSPIQFDSLVQELQNEQQTTSISYLNREGGRKSVRKHPHSEHGISYQACGGGRRVIRKKIGGE